MCHMSRLRDTFVDHLAVMFRSCWLLERALASLPCWPRPPTWLVPRHSMETFQSNSHCQYLLTVVKVSLVISWISPSPSPAWLSRLMGPFLFCSLCFSSLFWCDRLNELSSFSMHTKIVISHSQPGDMLDYSSLGALRLMTHETLLRNKSRACVIPSCRVLQQVVQQKSE